MREDGEWSMVKRGRQVEHCNSYPKRIPVRQSNSYSLEINPNPTRKLRITSTEARRWTNGLQRVTMIFRREEVRLDEKETQS